MKEDPLHAWKKSAAPALVLVAVLAAVILVYISYGTGGLLVLAVVGSLVGSYSARRYLYRQLVERYPRHGDHMD